MVAINKTNSTDAEDVLIQNGFTVISTWWNDNIYIKYGIKYGISHPVWNGKNVNIYGK